MSAGRILVILGLIIIVGGVVACSSGSYRGSVILLGVGFALAVVGRRIERSK